MAHSDSRAEEKPSVAAPLGFTSAPSGAYPEASEEHNFSIAYVVEGALRHIYPVLDNVVANTASIEPEAED